MDSSAIKYLLTEYEAKRRKAILQADEKRQKLLEASPQLSAIEKKLATLSIDASKAIVLAPPSSKQHILEKYEKEMKNLQLEKEKALISLGNNPSFLEPVFECDLCKDTGYILQGKKSVMCSCLKQKIYDMEYNKSNMGNLEKENFSTFDFSKYSSEIDFEKYHSDISPRENISLIKEICEQFILNFDDPNEKNLLFTGNTGLGKTFLSNCIANELLHIGKTVLYQTASVMLDTILDYRFNKPNCNQDIVENLLTVDLLIIDDLGTETMNSMKFTELFNVINTRLLNQNHKITKTIISTNLSLKNIFSVYEERLGSRFVGYYNICRFFGDDIRFMK